jgi:hypothetical protein
MLKSKKSILQTYEISQNDAFIINTFLALFGTLSGYLSSNTQVFYQTFCDILVKLTLLNYGTMILMHTLGVLFGKKIQNDKVA